MTKTDAHEKATRPDDDWARNICKIGTGERCCRFLTVGPEGWSCEKATAMGSMLTERAAAGNMTSQGDNCEGRAS